MARTITDLTKVTLVFDDLEHDEPCTRSAHLFSGDNGPITSEGDPLYLKKIIINDD